MASKFEDFKERWLEEIEKDNYSNIIKGRKFAEKLLEHWLHIDCDKNNIIYGKGNKDGALSLVYFHQTEEGSTCYFIQTEDGRAFENSNTLITESNKLIIAIGKNQYLSSITDIEMERIQQFKSSMNELDKFILLIASINPLSDEQKEIKESIKGISLNWLSEFGFEIKDISLSTLYNGLIEDNEKIVTVKLQANIADYDANDELLIGSVNLDKLYNFLKEFESKRGDFNLIYKKNVRMFLGVGKSVNRGIRETIKVSPEKFGLYNNGITIVVQDYNRVGNTDKYELTQPYIVNGCQTTKTIYDELKNTIGNPSYFANPSNKQKFDNLCKGKLVIKIVKAADDEYGKNLLKNTTKYTNSQNTVSLIDFIALDENFHTWAKEFEREYNVFLEIQRGAYEFNKERLLDINGWVQASELVKVYSAAWLEKPGKAYGGATKPFSPEGIIYKHIMDNKNFGSKDLYASYLIHKLAFKLHFGKKEGGYQRGQTKMLFCYIVMQLLKHIFSYSNQSYDGGDLSDVLIKIFNDTVVFDTKDEIAKILYEPSLKIIEDYITPDGEYSMSKEYPTYKGDSNSFLKNEKLGKSSWSPNLMKLIEIEKKKIISEDKSKQLICQPIIDIILQNAANDEFGNSNKNNAISKVSIEFPDGTKFNGTNITDIYVRTIEKIYELKGYNAMNNSYDSILTETKPEKHPEKKIGKYWLKSNWNSPRKISIINKFNEALGLGLKIDVFS